MVKMMNGMRRWRTTVRRKMNIQAMVRSIVKTQAARNSKNRHETQPDFVEQKCLKRKRASAGSKQSYV